MDLAKSLPTLWLMFGCSAPDIAPAGIEFVQGGIVVDGGIGAGGEALTDGRSLILRDWAPGAELTVTGTQGKAVGTAPPRPTCVALFHVGVGNDPGARIAFAPDDQWLAITKSAGERMVVDGWRGVSGTGTGVSDWSASTASLPPRCKGGPPVVRSVIAADGHRFAALEGPLPDGEENSYRVTVFR